MKSSLFTLIIVLINFGLNAQCYDDACDDDNDIGAPFTACCTGNTAGATWSGYGDVGCVNMGTATNPDVWISFTANVTGFIQITIDNITQSGITQFVVFDHQNSEVCASLNSFGILAGSGCNDLPGDGVGGVTSIDTVEYAVEIGERYWILVSADVQNGATPGTFTLCVDLIAPPPPPPPAPGQDCVDAQVLCNESGSGFYNGQLDLGDGNIEENTTGGWSSCIGNEQSSQWYTFTASSSGTIEMMLTPDNYTFVPGNGPGTGSFGDDFDWELYNITASGCTNTAVSLACDYAAPRGSTGFSATGAAGFGQVSNTDYQAPGGGPGDQNQWNTTNVSLVAGNTYALIVQNYSGSLGGVTVDFQGTSIIGPVSANAEFSSTLISTGCEAQLSVTNAVIPNYIYTWDFGDGTTFTGSAPPDHYYTEPGTYIVSLVVADPLGCTVDNVLIIDVADCVVLPVGLIDFDAELTEDNERVNLEWATNSEQDNDFFTIEKSIDGYDWERLREVDGVGNSTTIQYYQSVDDAPYFPTTYYRLKQTDFSGEYSFSNIVSTTNDAKIRGALIAHLAPNPAKDYLSFEYSGFDFTTPITINVFNELGQLMSSEEVTEIHKNMKFAINTRGLGNGVYRLDITQEYRSEGQKFVVLH